VLTAPTAAMSDDLDASGSEPSRSGRFSGWIAVHPDQRPPATRPLDHLRGAADGSILVPSDRFDALLDGLVDLARTQPAVDPALILVQLPTAAAQGWELVAAVLMANLRGVDVISRLDDDRFAVALDAAPAAARSVARRVHKLMSQTFVFEPTWVGVAMASPALGSGAELLAAATGALDRARREQAGGIAAVP